MSAITRLEQFERLAAQQPANPMFRFSLAQALIAAGRGSEAVPHLEYCAASRADWMVARILLGKELLHAGRRAEARPVLEEALRLAIEQRHEEPEQELRAILAAV